MSHPLKILLLEDSPSDAELIRTLLVKELPSCKFLQVEDRAAFIDALETFQPDVVLSDSNLPAFSGSEALLIVRLKDPQLPFILVSGFVSEEFAVEIIKSGADDYILKDRLARLPSAVHASLKHRETEKEKNRVNAQLRDSEMKYRVLVERIKDSFIAADQSGRISYINNAAERLLGRRYSDVLGRKLEDELDIIEVKDICFDAANKRHFGQSSMKETYSHFLNKWIQVNCYFSETGTSIFLKDITMQRVAELKALRHELNYKTFVDRITDAFIVIDKFFNYTYINKKAEQLMRRNASEVIGKNIRDVFPDAKDSVTLQAIREAMELQHYVTRIDYYEPFDFWYENHIYPSPEGVTVFIRDISRQKQQEQKLRDFHARMAIILNTLPADIVMIDPEGKILEVNDSWYGFAQNNGVEQDVCKPGNNYFDVCEQLLEAGTGDWLQVENELKELLNGHRKKMEYNVQPFRDKRWYSLTAVAIQIDHTSGAVVMLMDITDVKDMEEERRRRGAEEQKKINAAVLEAQERERDFIGSELHDNINQQQVGIQLMLARMKKNQQNDHHAVDQCLQALKHAIVETRKLAHELVTPDFVHKSLTSQISEVLLTILSAVGIHVIFDTQSFNEHALSVTQKIGLYRIVQEQCLNILKHAKASEVSIKLSVTYDKCFLIIRDNGVGMLQSQVASGIGLRNIRARLSLISGRLDIYTNPSMGFELKTVFPVHSGDV